MKTLLALMLCAAMMTQAQESGIRRANSRTLGGKAGFTRAGTVTAAIPAQYFVASNGTAIKRSNGNTITKK